MIEMISMKNMVHKSHKIKAIASPGLWITHDIYQSNFIAYPCIWTFMSLKYIFILFGVSTNNNSTGWIFFTRKGMFTWNLLLVASMITV